MTGIVIIFNILINSCNQKLFISEYAHARGSPPGAGDHVDQPAVLLTQALVVGQRGGRIVQEPGQAADGMEGGGAS